MCPARICWPSGNTVGRASYPDCGSSVYNVNSGVPDLIFLRASILDDPDIFKPQMVVYTKSGPAWDHMAPDCRASRPTRRI